MFNENKIVMNLKKEKKEKTKKKEGKVLDVAGGERSRLTGSTAAASREGRARSPRSKASESQLFTKDGGIVCSDRLGKLRFADEQPISELLKC